MVLAVAEVGKNAFSIARELVAKTIIVHEYQISLAILRLLELEKSVVEGAGAAPLAACLFDDITGNQRKERRASVNWWKYRHTDTWTRS